MLTNKIKITRDFLIISLSLILLSIVLEYSFVKIVSTRNTLGFYYDFNILKYIESKLLLLFVLTLSYYPFRKSQFIYFIYISTAFLFFLPAEIIYEYMNLNRGPLYSIIFMLCLIAILSPHKIKIKTLKFNDKVLFWIIITLALILLVPIIYQYGFSMNFNLLLLKEVYITREKFTENSLTWLNYIYNWEARVVIPIALILTLIKKKYFFSFLLFGVLMYLFLISGNKFIYFSSMMMVFFYFLGSTNFKQTKYLILFVLLGMIIIIFIENAITYNIFTGTFIVRMLFFPALLNYYYFDFFNNNYLFFAESHFFNILNEYPYHVSSGFLIAQKYLHVYDMNANNGIISDGFMNLGYYGIVLNSFIVALVFLLFNSLPVNKIKFAGIFFIFIYLFLSGPLLTIFITNGLLILILLCFLLNNDSE